MNTLLKLKLLLLAAALAACSSNSNKISKAGELKATAAINFTAGTDQSVLRRQELPTKMAVKVTNTTGQPFPSAGLVLCLLDVTGFDATTLDKKAAFAACEGGKTSISTVPYSDDVLANSNAPRNRDEPVDIVGRPVDFSGAADANGETSFGVVAPNKADRTIAAIVYLSSQRSADTLGFGLFKTVLFGSGSHYAIDSTNHSSESAGGPFALSVYVQDQAGYVVQSFSGQAQLEIVYSGKPSWLNRASKMPEGTFTCTFVQGKCDVPGGPWTITRAEKTSLQLIDHSQSDATLTFSFEVKPNVASEIIVVNKVGGPDASAQPLLADVELDLGQAQHLAAAIVDAGGNFLHDATSAMWTVSEPSLNETIPGGQALEFDFFSTKAGSGKLAAASSEAAVSTPVGIKVRPGVQDRWQVTTENHGTEVAGNCFRIYVTAVDAQGNTVYDVEGPVDLSLHLAGLTESGPAVADVAHFDLQGHGAGRATSETVQFAKGIGILGTRACFYDASNVDPLIAVATNAAGSTSVGQTSVKILPGPASRLTLSTSSSPNSGDNPCAPIVDRTESPCITLTADQNGQKLYVFTADKGGNPLTLTSASWTATGPLTATLDNHTFAEYAPLTLSALGTGKISIINPEGLKFSAHYAIAPGAPSRYTISTEHTNVETADRSFSVRFEALDQFNNSCTTYSGTRAAIITLQRALASPGPKFHQPTATLTEPLVFTNGIATTSGKLAAVYATSQPGVASPTKPFVRLALGGSTFDGPDLTVNAGTPNYLALRTSPEGRGLPITAPLSIHVSQPYTIYVAGYDLHGNYTGDQTASFAATGSLTDSPSNVSTTSGTNVVLFPSATGAATFTATPLIAGLPTMLLNPVNVTSSTAENFAIETTNSLQETAGVPFQITIKARDRQFNVTANYEGDKTLHFVTVSAASWGGIPSVMPDGNIVCTFVSGVCTLSTAGVPTDFKVSDSRTKHFITVTDVGNEVPGDFSSSITALQNAPARTVITDKVGGPTAGAVAKIADLTFTADDNNNLFAAAVADISGNFISDAPAGTVWSGTVAEIQNGLVTTTGPSIVFNAGKVGSGKIAATAPGIGVAGTSGTITVTAGVPAAVDVAAGTGGVVTAGQDFDFTLSITDADGNTQNTINRTIFTTLTWVSDSSGPDIGAGPGRFYDTRLPRRMFDGVVLPTMPVPSLTRTLPININFINGVGTPSPTYKGVLYDATNTTPKIHVALAQVATFAGLTADTSALTVSTGPADHITFTRGPGGTATVLCNAGNTPTENAWLAAPYAGTGESGWPTEGVNNIPACLDIIAGDPQIQMYAQVRDAGNNYLGDANGSWSFVSYQEVYDAINPSRLSEMAGDLSATTGNHVTYTPRIATVDEAAGATTTGWNFDGINRFALLKFTSTSPGGYYGWAPVRVDGGPAVDFKQSPNGYYADAPATLLVSLLDAYGNPGRLSLAACNQATYQWNGAAPTSSPKGTAPTIFPTGYDPLFIPGVLGGPTGFPSKSATLPRAGENLRVKVTVPALGTFKIFDIFVSPGSAETFKLLDVAASTGVVIPANPTFTTDSTPYFQASLWDSEQNYVGASSANFAVDGVFVGQSTATSGVSFVKMTPLVPGTGHLVASPIPWTRVRRNPADGSATMTPVNLGLVTVVEGTLDHFELLTEHSGTEQAGQPFNLIVRAKDQHNNTILGYNNTLNVNWNVVGGGDNNENLGQVVAGATTFPAARSITFANGVMSTVVNATFYNSNVTPSITLTSAAVSGQTPANVTVVAGPLDHYGVYIPSPNYSPRADHSTSFSATIEPRDAYGNLLPAGESGVILTMVNSDGTPAVGNILGTGTGGGGGSLDLSTGYKTVNNLVWDAAGTFRVKATKAGGKTTPVATGSVASTILVATATLRTIDRYTIGFTSPVTAGNLFQVVLQAVDKSGTKISGIDTALNGLTFTWAGFSDALTGQHPSVFTPATLPWSGGQANANVTTYRAQTISSGGLTVTDNQTPTASGASASALVVTPGVIDHYDVTTSNATPAATPAGTFNLTFNSYDVWNNPALGDPNVTINPVRQGGLALVGPLHGAQSSNINFSASATNTVTGLYYMVPHSIKVSLTGTAATTNSATLNFSAAPATISSFALSMPSTVAAGFNNLSVTVLAKDEATNTLDVTGFDSTLNALSYGWTGAASAPSGLAPTYASSTLSFSHGSATAVHSLYKAEVIPANQLVMTSTGSISRTGSNSASLTVTSPGATKLVLTAPSGVAVTAGVGFPIKVQAQDNYNNLDPNFTSANLNFAWVNTHAAPDSTSPYTTGLGATAATALTPSQATRTFVGGEWNSGGTAFALYNTYDSNVALSLVSPVVSTANLGFTVTSTGTVAKALVQSGTAYTSTAYPSAYPTLSSDSPAFVLYAHGYDNYGNWLGLKSLNWSGTGAALSPSGSISPDTNTNFATITPTVAGSGTLALKDLTNTTTYSSVAFTVDAGAPHLLVQTQHSGSEAAGTAFSVSVSAVDSHNNVVPTFTGTKTLYWAINNATPTIEGRWPTIKDGSASAVGFPMNAADFVFSNGVMTTTVLVTLANSADVPTIAVSTGASGTGLAGTATNIATASGAVHHYGVYIGNPNYTPKSDRSTTFSATIDVRDASGNVLPSGGETGVQLTMVKASDGSAATGTLAGTTTGINLSAGSVTLTNLAWDIPGSFELRAAKPASGTLDTPVGNGNTASTVLNANPDLGTIKKYNISFSSPMVAGIGASIILSAVDNNNNVISGIDSQLNAATFTWGGASVAPDTITAPSYPGKAFIGGQSPSNATFYKAEVIATGNLTVHDNQATPRTGVSTSALTVGPNVLNFYSVTTSNATRLADPASTFDLTVSSYDAWSNPRAGEPNVSLSPVQVSGATFISYLHSSGNLWNINLSGATSTTLTGISYLVPHTIKFVVGNTLVSTTSDQIAFTANAKTIYNYRVDMASYSIASGASNAVATVTAQDEGYNAITTLDSTLNTYNFTWSGAGTAPGNQTPTYGAMSSFSSGVATATHSFYKSETFTLSVQDDYSTPRTGQPFISLSVNPRTANKLVMSATSTSATAGGTFDITVRALDLYDNVDTSFTSGTLNFGWLNANPSVANVTSPGVLPSGTRTFTSGVFQTSAVTPNAFGLYNSADTGVALHLTSPPLPTADLAFTVAPTTLASIKFRDGSASTATLLTGTQTINVDDPIFEVYSHGYDTYGNWRGPNYVDWTDTGTAGVLHTGATYYYTSRSNSTSTAFTPNGTGSATLKGADHTTSSIFATLPVTVTAGQATKYLVTYNGAPSNLTAGTSFSIVVKALDVKNNVATTYTGSHSLSYSFTGATNSPSPAAQAPITPATGNQTFTAGQVTIPGFSVYHAGDTSVRVSVAGDVTTGLTGTLAVVPGTGYRYRISGNGTQTAGTAFDLSVTAYDQWDNIASSYASTPSLNFAWQNSNTSYTGGFTAVAPSSYSCAFTAGSCTTTGGQFKAYNTNDTASLTMTGGLGLETGYTSYPAGGFALGVASPISYIKIKDASANGTLYGATVTASTMTADQSRTYYVHAYDLYGNWVSSPSVTWAGTGQLSGKVSPTSGSTTTLSPVLAGSGTVTATLASPSLSDATSSFTIDPGALNNFNVALSSYTATAGTAFTATVTAYDGHSNIKTNLGSATLDWLWQNATATPAPASKLPTNTSTDLPASNASYTFTNGVYTATNALRLYNVANTTTSLKVTQTGQSPTGTSSAVTSIAPGSGNKYRISGTTSQTAGAPFNMTVTAYDSWDNVATGYASSASLAFAWQSSASTYVGSIAAVAPSSYSCTFSSGVCNTAGTPFTLYKIDDAATLTLTGGLGLEGGYNSFPNSGSFSVSAASPATYLKIKDSSASPTIYTAAVTTSALTTTQTRAYYAHAYDTYGNWKSSASVTWAGTGQLAGKVSGTSGSGTTLSPTLTGSGTVTAALASPSLSDATGSITINPAALDHFTVSVPATVTAGVAFDATVTAYDINNNVKTDAGALTLDWVWQNYTASPAPVSKSPTTAGTDLPTSGASYTFSSGVYTATGAMKLYNAVNTTTNLKVTKTSGTPTGTSSAVSTINAGAAALWYATTTSNGSTLTATAGTGFNLKIYAQDIAGNPVSAGAPTLTWLNASNAVTGGNAPNVSGLAGWAGSTYTSVDNGFVLYRMTGTNYDTAANIQLRVSGSGMTAYNFPPSGGTTVNAGTTSTLWVMATSTIAQPPGSAYTNGSLNDTSTLPLYANGYDQYGNWTGLQNSDWSGTGVINGHLSASQATSSTFTPWGPGGIGSGTVTATIHSAAPTSTTGTITVVPTTATALSVALSATTSTVAGNTFDATVTALDAKGNTATSYAGSKTLDWAWNASAHASPNTSPTMQPASNTSYSFTSGVHTETAALALVNASDTGVTMTVTDHVTTSINGTSAALAVTPAAFASGSLNVSAIGTQTANTAFSPTATVIDAYGNGTNVGCVGGTISVACSSGGACTSVGGHGGTATAPTSGSASYTINSSGVATISSVKVFKSGSNTLRFTASCDGSTYADKTFSVNPSTLQTIYLSDGSNLDGGGFPTAHITSVNCTSGNNVTCPTISAFAWDAYGNTMSGGSSWSCPTSGWTYVDSNSTPFSSYTATYSPALTNSSGHSTTTSGSYAYHVNGAIKCSSGAVNAQTTLNTTIVSNRPHAFSCGAWACASANQPAATCTLQNTSGYDTTGYSFGQTGTASYANCSGGLTGVGSTPSCNLTVNGTTGAATGTITATPTITTSNSENLYATLANATASVSGNAPNCAGTLTANLTSDWSCAGNNDARFTIQVSNNNDLNNAVLASGAVTFAAQNGASIVSNTCSSSTLNTSASNNCSITIKQPTAGNSQTVQVHSTSSFFSGSDMTYPKSSAPNCSSAMGVSAGSWSCNATNDDRITLTVSNPNTLQDLTFGASGDATLTVANGATIVADTCASATLHANSAETCTVTLSQPTGSLQSTIQFHSTNSYFPDANYQTAASAACP